jgi:hypothetical protein
MTGHTHILERELLEVIQSGYAYPTLLDTNPLHVARAMPRTHARVEVRNDRMGLFI